MTQDLNTLICLFHHQQYAQSALEEILSVGIPEGNVTLIGAPGSNIDSSRSSLAELNVPQKDLRHLLDGIQGGGAVLSVSAISADAEKVEGIFEKFRAGKIDEADVADDRSADAIPLQPLADHAETTAVSAAAGTSQGLAAAVSTSTEGRTPNTDTVMVIERDILLIEDPELTTSEVAVFDAVPVTIQTVLTADAPAEESVSLIDSHDENGKPDLDPREMGFDARMQPVVFSPQVH